MRDRPIASDLSYEVLQLRRLNRETGAQVPNFTALASETLRPYEVVRGIHRVTDDAEPTCVVGDEGGGRRHG